MKKQESIKSRKSDSEWCENLVAAVEKVSVSEIKFERPDKLLAPKSLDKELSRFGAGLAKQDVLMFMDETVLRSGKKGCLLTADAIYSSYGAPLLLEGMVSCRLIDSKSRVVVGYRDGNTVVIKVGLYADIVADAITAIIEMQQKYTSDTVSVKDEIEEEKSGNKVEAEILEDVHADIPKEKITEDITEVIKEDVKIEAVQPVSEPVKEEITEEKIFVKEEVYVAHNEQVADKNSDKPVKRILFISERGKRDMLIAAMKKCADGTADYGRFVNSSQPVSDDTDFLMRSLNISTEPFDYELISVIPKYRGGLLAKTAVKSCIYAIDPDGCVLVTSTLAKSLSEEEENITDAISETMIPFAGVIASGTLQDKADEVSISFREDFETRTDISLENSYSVYLQIDPAVYLQDNDEKQSMELRRMLTYLDAFLLDCMGEEVELEPINYPAPQKNDPEKLSQYNVGFLPKKQKANKGDRKIRAALPAIDKFSDVYSKDIYDLSTVIRDYKPVPGRPVVPEHMVLIGDAEYAAALAKSQRKDYFALACMVYAHIDIVNNLQRFNPYKANEYFNKLVYAYLREEFDWSDMDGAASTKIAMIGNSVKVAFEQYFDNNDYSVINPDAQYRIALIGSDSELNTRMLAAINRSLTGHFTANRIKEGYRPLNKDIPGSINVRSLLVNYKSRKIEFISVVVPEKVKTDKNQTAAEFSMLNLDGYILVCDINEEISSADFGYIMDMARANKYCLAAVFDNDSEFADENIFKNSCADLDLTFISYDEEMMPPVVRFNSEECYSLQDNSYMGKTVEIVESILKKLK